MSRDEISGPVLSLIAYADDEDAIHIANTPRYSFRLITCLPPIRHGRATLHSELKWGAYSLTLGARTENCPPSFITKPLPHRCHSSPGFKGLPAKGYFGTFPA
jgi:hypothetical protein